MDKHFCLDWSNAAGVCGESSVELTLCEEFVTCRRCKQLLDNAHWTRFYALLREHGIDRARSAEEARLFWDKTAVPPPLWIGAIMVRFFYALRRATARWEHLRRP